MGGRIYDMESVGCEIAQAQKILQDFDKKQATELV